MSTYQRPIYQSDGEPAGVEVTPYGKPTPHHALTDAAESARQALRDHAARRSDRQPTRRDIEAAYVHPAPERVAELVTLAEASKLSKGAATFAARCQDAEAAVKLTAARGTTWPRWHVPADTTPDPADYHGDVVDSVVVWARTKTVDLVTRRFVDHRVRAEWHANRSQGVTLNGQRVTLKAALEALS